MPIEALAHLMALLRATLTLVQSIRRPGQADLQPWSQRRPALVLVG